MDFLRFKLSGAGVPDADLELSRELAEAAEAAAAPLRVVAGITDFGKSVKRIECFVRT